MIVTKRDDECGVCGISGAGELTGLRLLNLRAYEASGLLKPRRADGGTRRNSTHDLARLRRLGDLAEAERNLAGRAVVMDLHDENVHLGAQKEEQQWLTNAPIPASRSTRRNSSSHKPGKLRS